MNPNLLLWTEELDNAVWTKTNCTVFEDQSGTADEVASTSAGAAIRQTTSTPAASGAAVTGVANLSVGFSRFSVSGTFDGLSYTFSIELQDTGVAATPEVTLRIDRAGGVLRCSIEDAVGDGDYLARKAQLELGASFTTYTRRGGT